MFRCLLCKARFYAAHLLVDSRLAGLYHEKVLTHSGWVSSGYWERWERLSFIRILSLPVPAQSLTEAGVLCCAAVNYRVGFIVVRAHSRPGA